MRDVVKSVLIGILLVAACLGAIYIALAQFGIVGYHCKERAVSTPEPPPIYPQSTLLKQFIWDDSEYGFSSQLHYEVNATPNDVIDYYDSVLTDGCSSGVPKLTEQNCYGDAKPFGTYRVDIELSDPTNTSYTIEVGLDRCGGSDF
jgi:hypothetical protein